MLWLGIHRLEDALQDQFNVHKQISLNTAAAKSSLRYLGNEAHCQSHFLKMTHRQPLCLCRVWRTVTLPSAVKQCPVKYPSHRDCLELSDYPPKDVQIFLRAFMESTGARDLSLWWCLTSRSPNAVLLPELHWPARLTPPWLQGHPSLQNQGAAAAWQEPESHIRHESDHSWGMHSCPTDQITSYGHTVSQQWRWLPFLRHVGVGTDPNN